jgi:hypothetical protein
MDVDELLRTTLHRQATSARAGSLDGPALRALSRGRRNAKWRLALAASSLAMVIAVAVPLPWVTRFDVSTGPDVSADAVSNGLDHGQLFNNAAVRAQAIAAARRPLVKGGLGWEDSSPAVIFAGQVRGRQIVVLERRSPRGERELGMVAAPPGDQELAAVAMSVGSADHRPNQISAVLGELLVMVTPTPVDAARWVFHDASGGDLRGSCTVDDGLWKADLTRLPGQAWAGPRHPPLGIQLIIGSRVVYRGPVGPLPLNLLPR